MVWFEQPIWLHAAWLMPAIVAAYALGRPLRRGWGRAAAAGVRLAILGLLTLALADPRYEPPAAPPRGTDVIFLRDASASIGAGTETTPLLDEYAAALPADVRTTVAVFGGNVRPRVDDQLDRDQTDIEAAIDDAVARVRRDAAGSIVLLSDGRATRGDALSAAARAQAAGLPVHVIPAGTARPGPPRIVAVDPPPDLRVGLTGHALVRLRSDEPRGVRLRVLDGNGHEVASQIARVTGDRIVALPIHATRKGVHHWRVAAVWDTSAGQALDTAALDFTVGGPPSVLVCDPDPAGLAPLIEVIQGLGVELQLVTPARFPRDAETLGLHDAIVLSDWPEPALTPDQLVALQAHVHAGGGLIFIGGARVSAAHWAGSPLEALLPVRFVPEPVEQEQQPRPVHVCYVLDVSGSMNAPLGHDPGGLVTKFDMMKTAVLASLRILPDHALATIIVFDDGYRVVADALPVSERDELRERIRRIGVGGGTNMAPPLEEAVQRLALTAAARHLIVLTDGVSTTEPGPAWYHAVRAADIAVTSIALGNDANTALLRQMARTTQGTYYFCDDAARIPRVFIQEAEAIRTITRVERPPITPRPGPEPRLLAPLEIDAWPTLQAAIAAEVRPGPSVEHILSGDDGAPLLARWRVGSGSVAAFLSDAKPVWARRWVEWPGFQRFWARVLTLALPDRDELAARFDVRVAGARCVLLLELDESVAATTTAGELAATLRLTDGDGPAVPLRWRRLPSGLWEGTAPVEPGRRYAGEFTWSRAPSATATLRRSFVVAGPTDPELQATGPDEPALRALAAVGGGRYDPRPDALAAAVAERVPPALRRTVPLWPVCLMLALVLWPVDLGVRRLLLRGDA